MESDSEAILEVSQYKTSMKNDSSQVAGHLRYICSVGESCGDGLLTKMRSSLWLLDFHDL